MARIRSRRFFIASGGACAGAALVSCRRQVGLPSTEEPGSAKAIKLRAAMRSLEVNGKAASVMGLEQANGKQSLSFEVNQPFDVLLENKLSVPTAIHWHGLHPPNNQDGVPGLTQPVIAPNASFQCNFPVQPAGTH